MGMKPRTAAKPVGSGPPEAKVSDEKEPLEVAAVDDRAKKSKSVRRSLRLQSSAVVGSPPGWVDAERVIQDITVVESEKEENGKGPSEQEHDPDFDEMSFKEKVDYLFHMVLEQKKILEELNGPQEVKRGFSAQTASEGEITYRNLYIESQKKVEALTEERQQLFLKLENARGQIEVYEKLKDALMCSSLTKPNEAALNLSTEATRSPFFAQGNGDGKNTRRKKEANGN